MHSVHRALTTRRMHRVTRVIQTYTITTNHRMMFWLNVSATTREIKFILHKSKTLALNVIEMRVEYLDSKKNSKY